jgi:hypothetical protein
LKTCYWIALPFPQFAVASFLGVPSPIKTWVTSEMLLVLASTVIITGLMTIFCCLPAPGTFSSLTPCPDKHNKKKITAKMRGLIG